ncbi:MAG: glycosyltransferase family 2 protein [Candidatus Omnitrophota bacterium]|jgi:glycosyltransferase involved in cell wall biosynthesis|nr:MAG: glycosyltransferase family 2 protein [Candidatus Omnitrophota bacterium]
MDGRLNQKEQVGVSIILPAFNERNNLKTVVESVIASVACAVNTYEVIIVDDGSNDGTGEVARLLTSLPNVKFFRHEANLGMGEAVKTGIRHAVFPIVMDIPCDNQFNAKDILSFIEKIKVADIVVGYRINKAQGFRRKFFSGFNILLLKVLFGLRLKDPTWVKMCRKQIFDSIGIESKGFFWETEVLVKAKNQGLRIEEVPTTMQPRLSGQSKGNSFFRAVDVLFSMLRLKTAFVFSNFPKR